MDEIGVACHTHEEKYNIYVLYSVVVGKSEGKK
jgi:hypothetical protein